MLKDPVDARLKLLPDVTLEMLTPLKLGPSADTASVKVPERPPEVTTARLDPCTPVPTLHLTDVSDTHSVASHPV